MVKFFQFLLDFLNNNLGLVTFIAATIAYLVYWKQKQDKKRNAAKIVLQEVRRAEDIISDYKDHRQYKFTKKIIATNSWARNIHHFVNDLNADELDKISNLYSLGEYLDSIITKISDKKFNDCIKEREGRVPIYQPLVVQQPVNAPTLGDQPMGQQHAAIPNLQIEIMSAPWQKLLDEITLNYEPIYHSTIINKLKRIAKLK